MALRVADLVDVEREVYEVCTKWEVIGLQLRVPVHKLKAIESCYTDPRKRLREVLIAWLKGVRPAAEWRVLVAALRDTTVAEYRVANAVERKYCAHRQGLPGTYNLQMAMQTCARACFRPS